MIQPKSLTKIKPKRTASSDYYDTKVSDHRYRIEKGLDLYQGACALEELVVQFFRAARIDMGLEPSNTIQPRPRAGITDVYLLLMGYAAECFLKARLARKLLRGLKGHRFDTETLPKGLNTHKLSKLCREAGISPTSREDHVLGLLEEAVLWRGRYPIPTLAADLKATVFSEGDLRVAKSLLQKFMPHLAG